MIEMAIVLASIGLLTTGVWAVVSVVWHEYKFRNLVEHVHTIATNIQGYYGPVGRIINPATGTPFPNGTIITPTLNNDQLRLIPVELRANPTVAGGPVNHDLRRTAAGTLSVLSVRNGQAFRVRLFNLEKGDCEKFLMQFPILIPEIGVERIATQAQFAVVNPRNFAAPSTIPLPMTLATANLWCAANTPTNRLMYDFKVQP